MEESIVTRSTLPEFFMPFETTGLNPWLDSTQLEMWRWIDTIGLAPDPHSRRHVERTNPALLAARFYPTADRNVMPLLAEFCAWGFIVDDEFDEGPYGRNATLCGKAIKDLCAVLEFGMGAQASPLEVALDDLWNRAVHHRSPGWCRQLANNIRGWLVTYHRTALEREAGFLPGIEEFREYRQFAVAMHMFMDLAEIVAGVDLPDRARYCSSLLDMRRATAEHVALLNDVFSAPKERGHEFAYNLVLMMEAVQECGGEAAMDRANAVVTGVVHNFLDARQRLPDELADANCDRSATSGALRTADVLKSLVRGNYDWHFETERYTHPEELGTGYPDYVPNHFAHRP
ncbi:terpene synthase family protein [Streptomyces sp. NPDC020681]|uniref:terpene synthase family protein n=1 Tax=Streptomyces sp. NPDC020681 TaxID=3365083 RepID=UPI0037888380